MINTILNESKIKEDIKHDFYYLKASIINVLFKYDKSQF